MEKRLEIGSQKARPGWTEYGYQTGGKNIVFDSIDCEDNYLTEVYWSHVIEHIPYCNIVDVIEKIYTKLEPGGKFRTVCPDLGAMIKAYNENDVSQWDRKNNHWGSLSTRGIYPTLGVGGMLMAGLCGSGWESRPETYLVSKERKVYGAISHVAAWDFNMLKNLLEHVGFSKVEQTELEDHDVHRQSGQLCVNAYK